MIRLKLFVVQPSALSNMACSIVMSVCGEIMAGKSYHLEVIDLLEEKAKGFNIPATPTLVKETASLRETLFFPCQKGRVETFLRYGLNSIKTAHSRLLRINPTQVESNTAQPANQRISVR